MPRDNDSRVFWPLLTGIGVFTAGFGALFLFWGLGDWSRDLPGLWDYRSATIGDGLLLPVAAAALVAAARKLPAARYESLVVSGAAVLGLGAGVVLQLAWFWDPQPQLNWTIPAPHTFNTPGYYHAAFLIAASGFFSAWVTLVLWRFRHCRAEHPKEVQAMLCSPVTALLIACLVGFTGLVVLDSYFTRNTTASLWSLVAIGIATLLTGAALVWSFGHGILAAVRTICWGCVLALAIWFIGWQLPNINSETRLPHLLVFYVGTIAIGLQLWATRDALWWIRTTAASLLLLSGLGLSLAATSFHPYNGTLLILVTVTFVGLTAGSGGRGKREVILLILALTLVMLALIIEAWLRKSANGNIPVDSIVSTSVPLLLTLLVPIGIWRYKVLINDEREYPPGRFLEVSFWKTWLTLVLLLLAAMVASFQLFDTPKASLSIDSPTATSPSCELVLLLGPLLAVGLSLMAVRGSQRGSALPKASHWTQEAPLRVTSETMLWATSAAVTWAVTPWVATLWSSLPPPLGPARHPFPFFFVILGGLIALWAGYITIDSLWANTARQEFYRFSSRAWTVCVACGLAVASSVAWLLTVGVWAQGEWARVITIANATAIVYLGGTVVVTMCAWALARSSPPLEVAPAYLTLHHPASNVFHDHLLHGFSLVATVFAVFAIDKLGNLFEMSTFGYMTLLTLAPSIAVLVPVFLFTQSTTDEHLSSEEETIQEELRATSTRRRLSEAMFARSDGSENDLLELNKERVRRIRSRLERTFLMTFALSPFGWIAIFCKSRLARYLTGDTVPPVDDNKGS
jgi:hypothetical protein